MKEALVPIHIEELPEGGFLATSDEVPGLVAQGRTLAETMEIAQDVTRKLVESYIEHGDPLPDALATPVAAGVEVQIAAFNGRQAESLPLWEKVRKGAPGPPPL